MLNTSQRRKLRNRNNIKNNNKSARNRVVVYRSNKNFSLQLVNLEGLTVLSYSTSKINGQKITGIEKAKIVGAEFSKMCTDIGITEVVFDKGSYIYNGRVKAAADSCRSNGLKF